MQNPQWDDEMKFELFRFRSELRLENIRVLAQPLGLGLQPMEPQAGRSLYPKLNQKPISSEVPAPHLLQPRPKAAAPQPQIPPRTEMPATAINRAESLANKAIKESQEAEDAAEQGFRTATRWPWLILSHIVDLGFIGICLAVGFIVLVWMNDSSSLSLQPGILAQSMPVQMLAQQSSWMMLIAVYAVFTCYWLFFKIVSGATLGETYMHNFTQREE